MRMGHDVSAAVPYMRRDHGGQPGNAWSALPVSSRAAFGADSDADDVHVVLAAAGGSAVRVGDGGSRTYALIPLHVDRAVCAGSAVVGLEVCHVEWMTKEHLMVKWDRWIGVVLLVGLLGSVSGCKFLSYVFLGYEQTEDVEASYQGLDGRHVAVMVAADEQILFQHPGAARLISRQLSASLMAGVEGIRLADPKQIEAFVDENPYWETLLPSQIVEGLGVDRLVLVGLYEYRLHEPGNAHVWRGVVSADVSVIEAEAEDPDNASFSSVVSVQYPTETAIGVLESDSQSVELGLLQAFGEKTTNLFREHEVKR